MQHRLPCKLTTVLLCISLLVCACNPQAEDPQMNGGQGGQQQNNQMQQQGAQQGGNPLTQAPQTPDNAADSQEEVAQRLVELATRLEDVQQASAVVLGRWAVVGINIDPELDRHESGRVKYEVAEALRNDPVGAYAIVSADPDVMTRLQEMNEEIRNGQPLEGIMEELADIVGRLMPQAPRNVGRPQTDEQQTDGLPTDGTTD